MPPSERQDPAHIRFELHASAAARGWLLALQLAPSSDGPSYGELGVAAVTFELRTAFFEQCSYYTNTLLPSNLQALIYAAKVARAPFQTPAGPGRMP